MHFQPLSLHILVSTLEIFVQIAHEFVNPIGKPFGWMHKPSLHTAPSGTNPAFCKRSIIAGSIVTFAPNKPLDSLYNHIE